MSIKNRPIYKKLFVFVCIISLCGCSTSLMFVSTSQSNQLKNLNREIKNKSGVIDLNNGEEIEGRILEVTADSVFYKTSEASSVSNTKVSAIRVGSKARGFYLLGIALTGYGVCQLSTAGDVPSLGEGLGKLYSGLGSILLGGGALTLGYYDFERTYYIN